MKCENCGKECESRYCCKRCNLASMWSEDEMTQTTRKGQAKLKKMASESSRELTVEELA